MPYAFLETNVVVLYDDIVVVEDESKCQTPHDGCPKENDEFLEVDGRVHEDNGRFLEADVVLRQEDVVFLEQHHIFLDEKIIVLSDHIERRRAKDGYPKDEIK